MEEGRYAVRLSRACAQSGRRPVLWRVGIDSNMRSCCIRYLSKQSYAITALHRGLTRWSVVDGSLGAYEDGFGGRDQLKSTARWILD